MRARKLAAGDDAFRSGGGRDAALSRKSASRTDSSRGELSGDGAARRCVASGTDSPLPSQGRGQGEGFAACVASMGEPLTLILFNQDVGNNAVIQLGTTSGAVRVFRP